MRAKIKAPQDRAITQKVTVLRVRALTLWISTSWAYLGLGTLTEGLETGLFTS